MGITGKSLQTVAIALVLATAPSHQSTDAAEITGIVYEDANANGTIDAGERPLPGVTVSDGRDVSIADVGGRYRIETEGDLVFVSVPGSHHATDNRYYQKIAESPESQQNIDFPLVRNEGATDDERFFFVFLTDTHFADFRKAKDGITKSYKAVVELKPAFVIHGGDIVYDAIETADAGMAEPQYLVYATQLAPIISSPFYHAVGNHDVFAWMASPDSESALGLYGKGLFKKYFGPTYYSFNYKHCHVVVLDSIGRTHRDSGEVTYHGFVDDVQLEWLKKDLSTIDRDTPIIIVTHIPTINALASVFGTRSEIVTAPDGKRTAKHQVHGFAQLIGDALKDRNFKLALAGHYHTYEEIHWMSNEHDTRFVVGGSICGEWWKGDHRLGRSSWPEGFTVIEVDGDKFTASYISYGWKGTEEK